MLKSNLILQSFVKNTLKNSKETLTEITASKKNDTEKAFGKM